MKSTYPPEFINRIDDVVIFNKLSQKALRRIVDLRVKEIQERLDDRRIVLKLTDKAKDWLAQNGYEPQYGARPPNRLIKRALLNPMSKMILTGDIRDNMEVTVHVEKNKLALKAEPRKKENGDSDGKKDEKNGDKPKN